MIIIACLGFACAGKLIRHKYKMRIQKEIRADSAGPDGNVDKIAYGLGKLSHADWVIPDWWVICAMRKCVRACENTEINVWDGEKCEFCTFLHNTSG